MPPLTANRYAEVGVQDMPKEELICLERCVEAIRKIVQDGSITVVLDKSREILDEYGNKLNSRIPGIGNEFLKWIYQNEWHSELIEYVSITKRGKNDYAEFPDSEGLNTFDLADRKFVATANAHPEKPPILQGTDVKWWG